MTYPCRLHVSNVGPGPRRCVRPGHLALCETSAFRPKPLRQSCQGYSLGAQKPRICPCGSCRPGSRCQGAFENLCRTKASGPQNTLTCTLVGSALAVIARSTLLRRGFESYITSMRVLDSMGQGCWTDGFVREANWPPNQSGRGEGRVCPTVHRARATSSLQARSDVRIHNLPLRKSVRDQDRQRGHSSGSHEWSPTMPHLIVDKLLQTNRDRASCGLF